MEAFGCFGVHQPTGEQEAMNQKECDDYTASLVGRDDAWLVEEVASRLAKVREAQRRGPAWTNVKDDEWDRVGCLSAHCKALDKAALFEAGVDLANQRKEEARRKQETQP